MKSFKMFAVATIITMFATACNDEDTVSSGSNNEKDVEIVKISEDGSSYEKVDMEKIETC